LEAVIVFTRQKLLRYTENLPYEFGLVERTGESSCRHH
jgi:hypothetical protein